jgi:hypothetical protein
MFTFNQELLNKARSVLRGRKQLFWIIGGSCSGKSTLCQAISQMKNIPIYDMDAQIYDGYMARYSRERHPASKTWFSAPNPLQWALSLSWEAWNGVNQATTAEYLDLLADDLEAHQPDRPLLIDGGITHPSLVAQVLRPEQVCCVDAPDVIRVSAWQQDADRAMMREWIGALPEPEVMWARFLSHDRLMTEVMVRESREKGICVFHRNESTLVETLAHQIAAHFGLMLFE